MEIEYRVDCEPHVRAFYRACGFSPTDAGLIRLRGAAEPGPRGPDQTGAGA